jgi:hypothetical protein
MMSFVRPIDRAMDGRRNPRDDQRERIADPLPGVRLIEGASVDPDGRDQPIVCTPCRAPIRRYLRV